MNFLESIKTCLFHKYYDFSGRASRSEYWFFSLFAIILEAVTSLFDVISIIATLLLFLPSIAVAARRLHDRNMSGWFQLLPIGLIWLSCFIFIVNSLLGLLLFFIDFGICIYFYILKGTDGPNKFGEETYHFNEIEYKNNTLLLTLKSFFKVKDSSTIKPETESSSVSFKKQIFCSSCHHQVKLTDKFCPNCGENIVNIDLVCQNCKTKNLTDAKYCTKCGSKL